MVWVNCYGEVGTFFGRFMTVKCVYVCDTTTFQKGKCMKTT